ncbi:MAG TPA: IS110 family transposase [Candidatus Angelobacter sp.]|nr:IS110 family transposase [Candidatus Angelobacter sp.]
MKRYLGVDLHRTQFVVCTRLENGQHEVRQWRIGQLQEFVEQLQSEDEIAVEAMGTTARFYDAVVGRVSRVVVVNPHQFKVISESVKKTDRNDAAALALYLAQDLLPEVRMKPKQHRELMHMAETRDLLVKQRSALKGKINNLLAMQGIELKREALSSKIGLERVLASPVSSMVQLELRVLVGQIRTLSESIAELEERLEEESQQLPGYANLTSIKGIGMLSATVLLTTIGKISDFADENKLAAYLGLVPKIENSNERERSGRITKQGNNLARTALVQCGLVAKRYSPYLNCFYERIKQRRGGGKAKIALARKLVKIVYDTLKNRWVFEDFPTFTLAA